MATTEYQIFNYLTEEPINGEFYETENEARATMYEIKHLLEHPRNKNYEFCPFEVRPAK